MYVVRFIRNTEYIAADLFLSSESQALTDDGRLLVHEGGLVPLPYKMWANILKCALFCSISKCAVDLMSTVLALKRAGDIGWTGHNCLGRCLFNFSGAMIVSVPERNAASYKRGRHCETLPSTVN